MKILRNLFMLALVFTFAACSGSKKDSEFGEYSEDVPSATADTDQVPQDEIFDELEADFEGEPVEEITQKDDSNVQQDFAASDSVSTEAEWTEPSVVGGWSSYVVQKGETLMKIAYSNYGDVYKWKKIYNDNQDVLKDPNFVSAGVTLKLEKTSAPFFQTNGEKYLIKNGDTLGKISNKIYGTNKKWRDLWENNKQLIRDPNKIYAGFHLFYLKDGATTLGSGGGDSFPSPKAERNSEVNSDNPLGDDQEFFEEDSRQPSSN